MWRGTAVKFSANSHLFEISLEWLPSRTTVLLQSLSGWSAVMSMLISGKEQQQPDHADGTIQIGISLTEQNKSCWLCDEEAELVTVTGPAVSSCRFYVKGRLIWKIGRVECQQQFGGFCSVHPLPPFMPLIICRHLGNKTSLPYHKLQMSICRY